MSQRALGLAYRHAAKGPGPAAPVAPEEAIDEQKLLLLAKTLGYVERPEQAARLAAELLRLRGAAAPPASSAPTGPLSPSQVAAFISLAKTVAKGTIGSWTAESADEGDWHTLLFRTPAITKAHEESEAEREEVLSTYKAALSPRIKAWAQNEGQAEPRYACKLEDTDWVSVSVKVK